MPRGFKLDSLEELETQISQSQTQIKKSLSLKPKKHHSTYLSVTQQKIQNALSKFRLLPNVSSFYVTSLPNVLSVSIIEKKALNGKYKTVYDFFMDLRRMICYYIKHKDENNEKYNLLPDLMKKCEELSKEYDDVNDTRKRDTLGIDRPMTLKEKASLANLMRGLPEAQLKGLMKLFEDKDDIALKNLYFEIDIEKLSTQKLRKIEKYVRSCTKSSKNLIPNRYLEEFKHAKQKKENKTE